VAEWLEWVNLGGPKTWEEKPVTGRGDSVEVPDLFCNSYFTALSL